MPYCVVLWNSKKLLTGFDAERCIYVPSEAKTIGLSGLEGSIMNGIRTVSRKVEALRDVERL